MSLHTLKIVSPLEQSLEVHSVIFLVQLPLLIHCDDITLSPLGDDITVWGKEMEEPGMLLQEGEHTSTHPLWVMSDQLMACCVYFAEPIG